MIHKVMVPGLEFLFILDVNLWCSEHIFLNFMLHTNLFSHSRVKELIIIINNRIVNFIISLILVFRINQG